MLDESVLLLGEDVVLQPAPGNASTTAKTTLSAQIGLITAFHFTLLTGLCEHYCG